MNENIKRKEILEKGYVYPQNLVTLKYTTHILERIEQRCEGLVCLPTKVRACESNIYSGRTQDGKTLNTVVVRLKYNNKKDLFICFNPHNGSTITIWFKDAIKGNNHKKDSRQAVRDGGSQVQVGACESQCSGES